MAKLSAHGYEVARIVTQTVEPAPAIYADLYGITEQRYEYHYSYRSDGHVLRRIVGLDTHPGDEDASRRRHDFGWKLWAKLRDPKRDTIARMQATAQDASSKAEKRGKLKSTTVNV